MSSCSGENRSKATDVLSANCSRKSLPHPSMAADVSGEGSAKGRRNGDPSLAVDFIHEGGNEQCHLSPALKPPCFSAPRRPALQAWRWHLMGQYGIAWEFMGVNGIS
jgi:hypothetical protein